MAENTFSTIDAQRNRPAMPGYGIHTNPDGQLSWAWVDAQMTAARNYWVASTRPDGRPHVAPVWGVWFEGALYFGTGRTSQKGRNLLANPAVVVHLESGDDTVILEGTVEQISDAALLTQIYTVYAAKYPGYEPPAEPSPDELWYVVRVSKGLAWQEHNFPESATRWQFAS